MMVRDGFFAALLLMLTAGLASCGTGQPEGKGLDRMYQEAMR